MNQATAHMKQLLDLSCDYVTAVKDTVIAYNVNQFELQAAFHTRYP